jgi:hypothetical protein
LAVVAAEAHQASGVQHRILALHSGIQTGDIQHIPLHAFYAWGEKSGGNLTGLPRHNTHGMTRLY